MNFAAPHIGFVIAAYAIAFVVIGGMIDRHARRLSHAQEEP